MAQNLAVWHNRKLLWTVSALLLLALLWLNFARLRSLGYRNLTSHALAVALTTTQPDLLVQAEEYAAQATQADPGVAGILAYRLGIAEQQLGLEEAAIAHYEKALATGGLPPSVLGNLLFRLAVHLEKAGESARAAGYFEEILTIDPNELPVQTLAHTHVYLGAILGRQSGDLLLQREHVEIALDLFVDRLTMDSYIDLATRLLATPEYRDAALEMAITATNRQPRNTWTALTRCRVYLARGEFIDATLWCERSRDLAPKNHHAHVWLGIAYESRGLLSEALAAYEMAASLNTENTWYPSLINKVKSKLAEE